MELQWFAWTLPEHYSENVTVWSFKQGPFPLQDLFLDDDMRFVTEYRTIIILWDVADGKSCSAIWWLCQKLMERALSEPMSS